MKGETPDWFQNEVVTGIQRLLSLSLDGRPAMETIDITAMMWVATLWNAPRGWAEELDRERIAQGFVLLAGQIDRWPAPKQLLDTLPPRPQRTAIESVQLTEAQMEENLRQVRKILNMLTNPQTQDKTHDTRTD